MEKYKLSDTKNATGLHQIIALRDIESIGVKKGDLGGWIEKEINLSQSDNAWVFGDAQIYGDAQVSGNTMLMNGSFLVTWAVCEGWSKSLSDKDGVAWISAGCISMPYDDAFRHWESRADRKLTFALLKGLKNLIDELGLKTSYDLK